MNGYHSQNSDKSNTASEQSPSPCGTLRFLHRSIASPPREYRMLAALQMDDKPSRAYTTTIAVCRHLSILAPAQYSSICAPMPHNSSCRVLPDILSVYPYSQIAALRSYTEAHSPSITQNAPANCTKSNSWHAQTLPRHTISQSI